MHVSPDFGVDFEPMVFGGGAPATVEQSEAQSRVIDGVPRAPGVPARAEQRPASRPAQTAPACAPTAAQIKRDLRARLRVVNAEIRLRAKLERERDTLIRLLAAADNKTTKTTPRADVRPIRSNVAG